MDNELGIIGYEKVCEQSNNFILIYMFFIYLFLLIITKIVFYTMNLNMIFIPITLIIILIFCVMFALCQIKNNKNKLIYIYFKNRNYRNKFHWNNNYSLKETVNFILENDIKPIENKDYYSVHFDIDKKNVSFYNKLNSQYELINI